MLDVEGQLFQPVWLAGVDQPDADRPWQHVYDGLAGEPPDLLRVQAGAVSDRPDGGMVSRAGLRGPGSTRVGRGYRIIRTVTVTSLHNPDCLLGCVQRGALGDRQIGVGELRLPWELLPEPLGHGGHPAGPADQQQLADLAADAGKPLVASSSIRLVIRIVCSSRSAVISSNCLRVTVMVATEPASRWLNFLVSARDSACLISSAIRRSSCKHASSSRASHRRTARWSAP